MTKNSINSFSSLTLSTLFHNHRPKFSYRRASSTLNYALWNAHRLAGKHCTLPWVSCFHEEYTKEEDARRTRRKRERIKARGGVVILRTLCGRGARRGSKELYYVPGVSSRGGGLWWNRRCEPAVRGREHPPIAPSLSRLPRFVNGSSTPPFEYIASFSPIC